MRPTIQSVVDAYEAFAPVYDRFTSASDYEAWTAELNPLIERHCPVAPTLLDLACGTGKSFQPFLRRGYAVTGCDISPAMLSLARARGPHARLFVGDLCRIGRIGKFGLVTCFDDSLNYLPTEQDLAAAVGAIARNLATDGLGLFDLNTLLAYRTTFAEDARSAVDGVEFRWLGKSTADCPPGCIAEATIEASTHGGRIVSRHRQRHFPPDTLLRLLAAAGLECLGVHGALADGSLSPALDEATHHKALYVVRPIGERR